MRIGAISLPITSNRGKTIMNSVVSWVTMVLTESLVDDPKAPVKSLKTGKLAMLISPRPIPSYLSHSPPIPKDISPEILPASYPPIEMPEISETVLRMSTMLLTVVIPLPAATLRSKLSAAGR